jgi:hypothetical protein
MRLIPRSISYTSVRNPKWSSENHTSIDCLVNFTHLKEEGLFTASPFDTESYGRELFARLVAGDFGEIAPFEKAVIDPELLSKSQEAFEKFANTESGCKFLAEKDDHNREIATHSSRGLAALAETHLSKELAILLQQAGLEDKKIKHMSFRDKISKAKQNNKISQKEHDALELIRKIRNEVVHESGGFYKQNILLLVQELHSYVSDFMIYKQASSINDECIDLIFIEAYSVIKFSLKARIDPKMNFCIVS